MTQYCDRRADCRADWHESDCASRVSVSVGEPGNSECVCAETSTRNCPVHGQGEAGDGRAVSVEAGWAALLHRAETEPINLDISDYGDEWCEGFLAGQCSVLEEVEAGRLALPASARTPLACPEQELVERLKKAGRETGEAVLSRKEALSGVRFRARIEAGEQSDSGGEQSSPSAEVGVLIVALDDALELAAEGWCYASDYFRDKWDFEGEMGRLRQVLTSAQATLEPPKNPSPLASSTQVEPGDE